MECPPLPFSRAGGLLRAWRVACIYTCDVPKRLGTYRVDCDLLAAVAVRAAERGETVTDVIIQRFHAYIRGASTGDVASMPPVDAPPVYTDVEYPASYEAPPKVPPCKHPADRVDPDAGVCHECGAEVW